MVSLFVFAGLAAFVAAYFTYAKYLSRVFELKHERPTPAHTLADGRDYHPAPKAVLLGHHFSSIAGAGPIVGPVFATLVFGWAPAVVWIILGSIFIGGVHDMSALAVSIRFKGRSIAQVTRSLTSPLAGKLFLVFVWLALVYVLVVFLDLTAATFAPTVPAGHSAEQTAALLRRGGGVASSSLMFILLALGLGLTLYRFKVTLWKASLLFVPLLFVAVWAGQALPLLPQALPAVGGSPRTFWALVLLAYCFVASITPVWILLQPRDFLSSFLLFACLVFGLAGVAVGPFLDSEALAIRFPAFLGFSSDKLGFLFPALFITIACGACSGFHSVVASGTTAKQLNQEPDARLLGYGSMLLEGVLALMAVATVATLSAGAPGTQLAPPQVFAAGLGRFVALLGIPAEMGQSFALLALSTFLLTTLDTCTRLGRYLLEELLELRGKHALWISTAVTLALPLALSFVTFHDEAGKVVPVWMIIWPVFGSTNQLLGGLALLTVTLWLRREGRPYWITLLPMVFMTTATLTALVQLTFQHGMSLVGIISAGLLALAAILLLEAGRSVATSGRPSAGGP